MGAIYGKGSQRMGVVAMATQCQFDRDELRVLYEKLMLLASKQGNNNIVAREKFLKYLAMVEISEMDMEILKRMWILFEAEGDKKLNFKEFMCGISVLLKGDLVEKLKVSLNMYDMDNTGRLNKVEMAHALHAMNTAVSFFGDENLQALAVGKLVDQICEHVETDARGYFAYADMDQRIAKHSTVVDWLCEIGKKEEKEEEEED